MVVQEHLAKSVEVDTVWSGHCSPESDREAQRPSPLQIAAICCTDDHSLSKSVRYREELVVSFPSPLKPRLRDRVSWRNQLPSVYPRTDQFFVGNQIAIGKEHIVATNHNPAEGPGRCCRRWGWAGRLSMSAPPRPAGIITAVCRWRSGVESVASGGPSARARA